MATFTPFMQGSEAQSIISNYLGGGYASSPNVNTAGQFRNPIFDIRTEQEAAGTLDPSALYPNPQIDYSVDPSPADPCPEGYMLVDGVCQPIEQFNQSYDEWENRDKDEREEREYHSIEDMKTMSDEDLVNYLKSGWLSNHPLGYLPSKGNLLDINNPFMPSLFGLAFNKQNQMRRNFIEDEMRKRGLYYNIGDAQKVVIPGTEVPENAVQVSNRWMDEQQMADANAAAIAQQSQAVQDQMNRSIQQSQQMGYGQGGGQPSNMGVDRSGQPAPRDYSRSPGAIFGDMEYDEE